MQLSRHGKRAKDLDNFKSKLWMKDFKSMCMIT